MKRHRWRGCATSADFGGDVRRRGDKCVDCGLVREYSRYSGSKSTARYWLAGKMVACTMGAWESHLIPRGCPPCEPNRLNPPDAPATAACDICGNPRNWPALSEHCADWHNPRAVLGPAPAAPAAGD